MLKLKTPDVVPDLHIGYMFTYDDIPIVVEEHVEQQSMCPKCALFEINACIRAHCMSTMRTDKTPVYFKKIK